MAVATLTREKKKRGLLSILNQLGGQQISSAPVVERLSENLTNRLNRMIELGASFDVATDDFGVFGSENLTVPDKYFLEENKTNALCHLQQSLLVKHLFNHLPEQFEAFASDIAEREAIMTGDAEESFPVHCEAVKSVTRKWFAELLNDKQKKPALTKTG